MQGRQLYPLHCACKRGNIFGVKWLISHGADVNVKDRVHICDCWGCADSISRLDIRPIGLPVQVV